MNGFEGTVNLNTTNVLSDIITATLSATILDLSAGPADSTLSIAVSSFISPGDHFFDVNATTSGTLFHVVKVTVRIPKMGMDINASPRFLTITPGSSENTTVTLTSIFGFASSVSLTTAIQFVPSGSIPPTVSPTSASITLNPESSVTQEFKISTTALTTPGSYVVNVTGIPSKASLSNSTLIPIMVPAPDFAIDAQPGQLLVPPGSLQTSIVKVTSIGGFAGFVDLSVEVINPNVTAMLTQTQVTLSPGSPGLSTLSVSTAANPTPGTYIVSVVGNSSSLVNFASVMVTVPGFSITSSPDALTLPQGYLATSTLTLKSLNGFQDIVDLSASCFPAGLSATLSAMQASITAGGEASSILTVSAASFTTPGIYEVEVRGSAESTLISNSTALVVTVTLPSFGFTMSAGLVTPAEILAGASGTSTITVTSVGGFSGLVNFSLSASAPAGLSCTPPASTTASSATILTCKASIAGDYVVIVAGTAAIGPTQVSRITSVPFHVVDFAISASSVTPSAVLAGSSGTSTITVTALNGFDQTVTLSVSTPAALSCNLNHTIIQSSGTSTIACTGSTPGDYVVTVTASSGTVRHQTAVAVHVTPRPLQASILGLQPALFYGLIGGIVVLGLVGGVALALRRKNP